MKENIYIETSIVSYLTSRPSRDIIIAAHQQITNSWWDNFRNDYQLFTSQLVLDEASSGDSFASEKRIQRLENIDLLDITDDTIEITENLLKNHCLPSKAVEDAMHIAIASIHNMKYLLTWNCKHIANARMRPLIEKVLYDNDYRVPIICTPEELLGE